jgi:hypothetical protein
MTMTAPSLFEREMRAQIAAAEASVIEATAVADPLLLDAARSHLDGLIDLARRNGLEITTLVTAEPEVVVIDIAEQPVVS